MVMVRALHLRDKGTEDQGSNGAYEEYEIAMKEITKTLGVAGRVAARNPRMFGLIQDRHRVSEPSASQS